MEAGIGHGLPLAGAVTSQLKVVDQQQSARSLRLVLSAPAGSQQSLFLRLNEPKVRVRSEGADVSSDSTKLQVQFPPGAGYVEKVVTLSW